MWSDEGLLDAYVTHYNKEDDSTTDSKGNIVTKNPFLDHLPTKTNMDKTFSTELIGKPKKEKIPVVKDCDMCNYLIALYPKIDSEEEVKINFLLLSQFGHIHLKEG